LLLSILCTKSLCLSIGEILARAEVKKVQSQMAGLYKRVDRERRGCQSMAGVLRLPNLFSCRKQRSETGSCVLSVVLERLRKFGVLQLRILLRWHLEGYISSSLGRFEVGFNGFFGRTQVIGLRLTMFAEVGERRQIGLY
jgi:hypothetical protein